MYFVNKMNDFDIIRFILIFDKILFMSISEIEHIILEYLVAFRLQKVGIFGSYARNEQKPGSDIDLLVKFKDPPSLLQLIKMENELSKKLGFKVDLITEGAIKNRRIKARIEQEIKVIYNA